MRTRRARILLLAALAALAAPFAGSAGAEAFIDSPVLAARVAAGKLPPIEQRLPEKPRVIDVAAMGREPGRHGGTMRMLMGDQRDIRMMTLYGYTRLVIYDEKLELTPDLLEAIEVERGRVFTRSTASWSAVARR